MKMFLVLNSSFFFCFTSSLGAKYKVQKTYDRQSLESRRAAIKDKDRLDIIVEKFADTAEETDDVCVADHGAVVVAHATHELVEPDTGIDRQALVGQGLELDGPCHRVQELPKAFHTHDGWLNLCPLYLFFFFFGLTGPKLIGGEERRLQFVHRRGGANTHHRVTRQLNYKMR